MTEIHKPSVDRVMKKVDPEAFLELFKAVAEEAEETGAEVGQVCMPYIDEGDEFVEGTWVPELWLVARKVLPKEEEENHEK